MSPARRKAMGLPAERRDRCRSVAIHEASHAVAAVLLGVPLVSVGLVASEWSDEPEHAGGSVWHAAADAEPDALIALAGAVGVQLAYRDDAGNDDGFLAYAGTDAPSGPDCRPLVDLPTATVNRLADRVARMLAANWPAVVAVADAVEHHGAVDGPTAERIARDAMVRRRVVIHLPPPPNERNPRR